MANINSRLLERSDNIILMVVKNKQKKKNPKGHVPRTFYIFRKIFRKEPGLSYSVCISVACQTFGNISILLMCLKEDFSAHHDEHLFDLKKKQ